MIALALVLLLASVAFAQTQPICRPGPAGSIICDQPTTPGQSATVPSYVTIVPYSSPPPPMGPWQNPLNYRAGIRDYCVRNLAGCGPTR